MAEKLIATKIAKSFNSLLTHRKPCSLKTSFWPLWPLARAPTCHVTLPRSHHLPLRCLIPGLSPQPPALTAPLPAPPPSPLLGSDLSWAQHALPLTDEPAHSSASRLRAHPPAGLESCYVTRHT